MTHKIRTQRLILAYKTLLNILLLPEFWSIFHLVSPILTTLCFLLLELAKIVSISGPLHMPLPFAQNFALLQVNSYPSFSLNFNVISSKHPSLMHQARLGLKSSTPAQYVYVSCTVPTTHVDNYLGKFLFTICPFFPHSHLSGPTRVGTIRTRCLAHCLAHSRYSKTFVG